MELDVNKEYPNIEKLREHLVVKANDILQDSRFNFTEQQQKIFSYIISKLKPEAQDFEPMIFDVLEFCRISGITICGKNYADLQNSLLALCEKTIWIKISEKIKTTLGVLEFATLDAEKNTITVKLHPTLRPFLLNLQGNFTQYELQFILPFHSKYSIRLYEILKSYQFRETFTLSISDLKFYLCCEDKEWQNFKQDVLVPAFDEINNLTDIDVSYEVLKSGRRFTHIAFHIKPKDTLLQCLTAEQKRLNILNRNNFC